MYYMRITGQRPRIFETMCNLGSRQHTAKDDFDGAVKGFRDAGWQVDVKDDCTVKVSCHHSAFTLQFLQTAEVANV
jgi:hypothetical protein